MITYNGNVLNCGGWLNAVPTPYPTTLPANTLRCRFVEGTVPVSTYGTWTKVVGVEDNLWDVYYVNNNWSTLLNGEYALEEVVAAGDLSSITVVGGLFNNCSHLDSVCNLNLPSVKNASEMLRGCSVLRNAPDIIFGNELSNMNKMFYGCSRITTIPQYNTSSVTSMAQLFYGCTSLNHVPDINTSNVVDMSSMFEQCRSLVAAPMMDTGKVTNMSSMFISCTNLVTARLYNTSRVTNMNHMYSNCAKLTNVPLYDTRMVDDVSFMFSFCEAVEGGALALYQQMSTQQYTPTSHSACFSNCGSLTTSGAAELAQIPTSWGGTMS